MARARVIDRDRGQKAIQKRLEELKGTDASVRVGVFEGDKNAREAVAPYQPAIQALFEASGLARPAPEVTNVDLGVWHEFGVPDLHIPERSWLRSSFDNNREKWTAFAGRLANKVLGGMEVERALGLLGLMAQADVKKGITTGAGIPPPNAPSTVKQKGSSRPLVDTSQFVNSISFEVGGNEGDE